MVMTVLLALAMQHETVQSILLSPSTVSREQLNAADTG